MVHKNIALLICGSFFFVLTNVFAEFDISINNKSNNWIDDITVIFHSANTEDPYGTIEIFDIEPNATLNFPVDSIPQHIPFSYNYSISNFNLMLTIRPRAPSLPVVTKDFKNIVAKPKKIMPDNMYDPNDYQSGYPASIQPPDIKIIIERDSDNSYKLKVTTEFIS